MRTIPEQSSKTGLARYLSRTDVWGMMFGCMVGWGVFVMPGTTFLPVAGPAGTTLAMGIGVAVMLILSVSFSYLMTRSPQTGGVYMYTKDAFGRDHAFICSWFLCLSYLTIVFLNGSALFVVVRTLLGNRLQTSVSYMIAGNRIYLGEVTASVLVLVCVGVLFLVAKPVLQRLQTVLAIILIAGVVVMALICLPHVHAADVFGTFGTQGLKPGYAVFSLVILAPWAFVGFEVVSFDTAHFRFPVRRIGPLFVAAILVAGFAYTAMNLVGITAVPDGYASWKEYIAALNSLSGVESVPTFYAARTYMGTAGLVITGITAIAAILTGIIGGYRATLRVLSTMAEDHILSERFSNTKFSILFIMILSVLISLLGRKTLSWFVDLTSFGAIVAYGYTSASAYKTAKAENEHRIIITGFAGTCIAIAFAVVQLVPRLAALEAMGSAAFLLLSLWCLLGFVFYWRTVTKSSLTDNSGMSVSGTVLFALLMYAALMWLGKRIMAAETLKGVQSSIKAGGIILFLILFTGLAVMLYVQDFVRKKHEAAEREKIRAVEGSLAKSQFLFNMSHDIRTPMNAIIGYTNLALQEPTSEKVHDYLTKIGNSGGHLLALINDILEMSRIESGKVELTYAPTDLVGIFEGIQELFSEQMKKKSMEFSVHTSQVTNRYVWCDRKNLDRVLLNVISNAYKFTPEHGNIDVILREAGSGEGGYGSYEIRVQDSGIGMSKDFVDKMFTAFERERTSTDSGVDGTGLGLAITKSIVDLMGGTIEVITSPGSGTEIIIRTKFRLADPAELEEENKTPENADEDWEIDYSQKRLLLVEDNLVNREIACMILEQQGFMVETAENGKDALDKVAASQPGWYDAILMDIQMPVMDGYAATKAIRALNNKKLADIPILAMTANAFKEDEESAAEAGMQAHIAKPVDVKDLMAKLDTVLYKRSGG